MKFNLSRTGVKVIYPSNQGISKIAQNRLDQVVGQANQRHRNALKVDGADLFIFTKNRTGNICTCQGINDKYPFPQVLNSSSPSIIKDSLNTQVTNIDENGNDLGATIYSIRLNDSGNLDTASYKKQNKKAINTPFDIIHKQKVDKNNNDPEDITVWAEKDMLKDDIIKMSESNVDPEDQARQIQSISSTLYGPDTNVCGICFGSGFINSYQLFGGVRYILESSDINAFNLYNCELDTTKFPNKFVLQLSNDPYVSWTIKLPTYFEECLSIQVRNNIEPAYNILLQVRVIGTSTWNTLTKSWINSKKGNPTEIEIRAIVKDYSDNYGPQNVEFTHIELFIKTIKDLPIGQSPDMNLSLDMTYYDVQQTINMEIGAQIPNFDREAVIIENKNNRIWKVIEIKNAQTQKNQIFNHEVQIRLIHDNEPLSLLNLIKDKPLVLNYSELEQIQGYGTELEE